MLRVPCPGSPGKESHPVGVDHGHIYGFSREMPSRLRSAEQGRLGPFNPTPAAATDAPTPAAGGQKASPLAVSGTTSGVPLTAELPVGSA